MLFSIQPPTDTTEYGKNSRKNISGIIEIKSDKKGERKITISKQKEWCHKIKIVNYDKSFDTLLCYFNNYQLSPDSLKVVFCTLSEVHPTKKPAVSEFVSVFPV